MKSQFDSPPSITFCDVFEQHTNALYLLALLLVADAEVAEQCFLSGLDSCLDGRIVPQECAYSWSKRAIIKSAIRLMAPAPEAQTSNQAEDANQSVASPLDRVRGLQPFDRFVFVMSVLESYPNRECAILLNCSVDDVVKARSRALLQIAKNKGLAPMVSVLPFHPQEIQAGPLCA